MNNVNTQSYEAIEALVEKTNFRLNANLDESGSSGVWDFAGELADIARNSPNEDVGQDVIYMAIRIILKHERKKARQNGQKDGKLTMGQESQLAALKAAVARAGYKVGITNNEATRAAYDEAIEKLVAFESTGR